VNPSRTKVEQIDTTFTLCTWAICGDFLCKKKGSPSQTPLAATFQNTSRRIAKHQSTRVVEIYILAVNRLYGKLYEILCRFTTSSSMSWEGVA
jgi:hypothetical protein